MGDIGSDPYEIELEPLRAPSVPEPSVPIFAKKRSALAEYPLTAPSKPTPETDSDFWTRGDV